MSGIKTEPAFGQLLNLKNPFTDLLELRNMSDNELAIFIKKNFTLE